MPRAWVLTPLVLVVALASAGGDAAADGRHELRVCADPNNLPFSSAREEGFENRLAELFARDLGTSVRYTWWPQRRGFVRHTLTAGLCDMIVGVPVGWDSVLTTRPYYRSTYVFVSRRESALTIASFDDPVLRRLRVGVQLVGQDGVNTPPAHALARRGIVENVVGFSLYGDYAEADPPARIIEAVAHGAVDTAIVWGPLAGYFASRQPTPLVITPVGAPGDEPGLPFTFAIAVGVRRDDTALRDAIDRILDRRRADITAILDGYHVPRVETSTAGERR
jgi:mxaJ protein